VTPALAFFPHLEHLFHGERSTQEIMINVIIHTKSPIIWPGRRLSIPLSIGGTRTANAAAAFFAARKRQRLTLFFEWKVWSRRAPSSRPRIKTKCGRWSQGRARVDFLTEYTAFDAALPTERVRHRTGWLASGS